MADADADAEAESDGTSNAEQDNDAPGVDELVARTAKRIADAINDFKRELDQRDSVWGTASGSFELALNTNDTNVYQLTIVHDPDGEEYPVSVRADLKTQPDGAPVPLPRPKPTRRPSDAALEVEILSRRKKRRLDDDSDNDEHAAKRTRTTDINDDEIMEGNMMPRTSVVEREDLENLLIKFREDIQDDTTECVNHVQRLLRRFKQEWHDRKNWEDEHAVLLSQRTSSNPQNAQQGQSGTSSNGNGVAFPSSTTADHNDAALSTADIVRRESKLLASQIRWVEECRRVAASVYDKREETWRTTSASFHERNRQDREAFQNRILHESTSQSKVLNQILNEVKRIGLYQQSMKWETPGTSHSYEYGSGHGHGHGNMHASTPTYPPPPSMVPQFPTQTGSGGGTPMTPAESGAGKGRGSNKKQ